MGKCILFKYIDFSGGNGNLDEVDVYMNEHILPESIGIASWEEYPYKPKVTVRAGWSDNDLYLKFTVRERTTRAKFRMANDPVHLDSCVEFFIDPGNGSYFNIEMNSIGTVYLGYGTCRADSRPMAEATTITSLSSIGRELFEEKYIKEWTITVDIPLKLFQGTPLHEPGGKAFRANFYKCGDELKDPHFLSMFKIESPHPDFHRPEYFGTVVFERP
jgi:hypothetical protein